MVAVTARGAFEVCTITGCDAKYGASGMCDTHHQRAGRYRLGPIQLDMIFRQERCDICNRVFKGWADRFADHDHDCCPIRQSCGECIRGIICRHCNTGLGGFSDSRELLIAAANYLNRAQPAPIE